MYLTLLHVNLVKLTFKKPNMNFKLQVERITLFSETALIETKKG